MLFAQVSYPCGITTTIMIRLVLLCVLVASSCKTITCFVPARTRLHGCQCYGHHQKQACSMLLQQPSTSVHGANDFPIKIKTLASAKADDFDAVVTGFDTVPAGFDSVLARFHAVALGFALSVKSSTETTVSWLLSHPSLSLVFWGSLLLTYFVVSSVSVGREESMPKPYPSDRYDATAADRYFKNRTLKVVGRAFEISITGLGFGFSILMDSLRGQVEENADERGLELATLLTKLGPTFIKVGQTLSIRTDLLPPSYIRGLQSLQDRVPAFETETAKKILEEEWDVAAVDSVVDLTNNDPVAAASLGQVYRARLKETGQDVAIKVQRPDIEERIALDMYLLRTVGALLKKIANINTDAVGTVDAWGAGFVDELDYLAEARNSESFMDGIASTPLKDVVFSPRVLTNLTTRKVLTTEWVDGERLDCSSNEDVTVLCSIAMNSYLTMMLELGTLHCDPHPGNLLRTPEGRLCILDWGMVTRLDSDLQISLIEHMAHLTSGDYGEIPRDLLLLDFIPESKADMIEDSGVVETLADVYGAFISGGRAAAPVNEVVARLSEMSGDRGNIFQIPPYFAYIAKSFSVLEGIGLGINKEYSIIAECLPYTSKRLLTDRNERTGTALSSFIFGSDKFDLKSRVVEYDRVEQLVTGFGEYTTSAAGELLGEKDNNYTQTEMLERYSDQVLDLIFAEEETPLQSILLEQLAKIFLSESRSLLSRLREASGTLPNGRSVLGAAVDPLGIFRASSIVNMDQKDEQIVNTTRKLITLAQSQLKLSSTSHNNDGVQADDEPSSLSSDSDTMIQLASMLTRKVWERRSAVSKTGNRFAHQVLNVTLARLEDQERSDNSQIILTSR